MQYPTTAVLQGSKHRAKGSFATMLPSFLPLQQVNTGRPWQRASPPAQELHRDLGLQTRHSSGCSKDKWTEPRVTVSRKAGVPFLEREEAWEIQGLWQGLISLPHPLLLPPTPPSPYPPHPRFCLFTFQVSCFLPRLFPSFLSPGIPFSNCYLNSLKHLHYSLRIPHRA